MAVKRSKPWQHATRAYRLRGWRRWLMWWVFGPLALIGLLLLPASDEGARTAGVVLLALAGSVLLAWHWLWRRTVLELTASGLRLRQLGYVLETDWGNVAAFHALPMREGFVLRQPLDNAGARRLANFSPAVGDAAALWLQEQRFIPVEAFAWHWQHGRLRAELEALAPAAAMLLNDALHAQAQTAPPVSARMSKTTLFGVAAVCIAAAALGATSVWHPMPWLERAFGWAYALLAPLITLQVAVGAWQSLRRRQWLMALLLTATTAITAAWCVLAWQALA